VGILEEPVQLEQGSLVVLTQPQRVQDDPVPCYIHIRHLTQLDGYAPCRVELWSGSRTVEVYSADDYLMTCRGTMLEECE